MPREVASARAGGEAARMGIERNVAHFIRALPVAALANKTVLDIPCGDGRGTVEFLKKNARVRAFDLFPEFMRAEGATAERANLMERLPLADASVDYILCQEGIEHVPDQLKVFKEFNRVLKKDGVLLLTTPSMSHLRARLSHFLFETDYWKRVPPTELDSIWFAPPAAKMGAGERGADADALYFGHLFLRGAQHYESLLTLAGFRVTERVRTKVGNTSAVLMVPLYPLLALASLAAWVLYRGRNQHIPQRQRDATFWQRVRLNLSPTTLVCKHFFWVMRKERELAEVTHELRTLQRRERHNASA